MDVFQGLSAAKNILSQKVIFLRGSIKVREISHRETLMCQKDLELFKCSAVCYISG